MPFSSTRLSEVFHRVAIGAAVYHLTSIRFEFEERWTDANGESWYAREMLRATVSDGRITEASIYCTGDWDQARQSEHAQEVTLLRP
jgi:hypothetical protein